jgi:drug/metabolite transporter superfamily protein YnfA
MSSNKELRNELKQGVQLKKTNRVLRYIGKVPPVPTIYSCTRSTRKSNITSVMSLRVVDASHGLDDTVTSSLEMDFEQTSLAELRGLLLSLPLPSSVPGRQHICFDGTLLSEDDNGATLAELGVHDAPAIVVTTIDRSVQKEPSVSRGRSSPEVDRAVRPPLQQQHQTPASPPPLAAQEVDDAGGPPADACCRICFGSANENGLGALISPCMCTGSMRYVHVACLNDWRTASANPHSFYRCDQCGYSYNTERTRWAAILESARLAKAVTALLLMCATLGCALLLHPLGASQRFFRFVAFDPRSEYHAGRVVAHQLWGWQLDALCSGLLGVAAFGVYVALRDAYMINRHVSHSWLLGVVTALMSNDERIYRVFAAFGGVVAARAAMSTVETMAKKMLSKWGTMILEVRR